jgi:putative ABC transport system ATP-binding protein
MLELKNVEKKFDSTPDSKPILHDLHLSLAAGQSVALIGESGSGKSTLLNIIAGLESFDAGEVTVCGVNLKNASASAKSELRAQKLGFVFQAFHLMPHLSAAQNIMLPLMLLGQAENTAKQRAKELLERLSLTHRADAMPAKLSGGEQQRVALARAVVHRPALVLADEPTGNLDPTNAQTALTLLLDIVRDTGASLLMVTHSEKVAASADFSVHLEGGRLLSGRLIK